MTAPNRNTLWARVLVEELARGGLEAVCVAPGSRSTPLTVAFADHDDLRVYSHLDERSAAYFALGRGRRTGEPTALVCTSGTAAANFHPAVVEASQARVPLVALTADRPPELRDSGANQTIDQEKLYGDAVRWYRDLPEPEPTPRKLRRLRTDAARALAEATGTPAGPVHLNCPFRKPLEPVAVSEDVPEDLPDRAPLAVAGRPDGAPFVRTAVDGDDGADGWTTVAADLASALTDGAGRLLLVAGPADPTSLAAQRTAVERLVRATDAPVLADPLSNVRYAPAAGDLPICGGYDAYVDRRVTGSWPDPDLVVRFGASPTSKPLRTYLARTGARQVLVDPAAGWREAEFTASDLVAADPVAFADALATAIAGDHGRTGPLAPVWRDRWLDAESRYWDLVDDATGPDGDGAVYEGAVVGAAIDAAPDPATVVVSNSMPVREADRFGRPRSADLTVLGNRGASGIDGVTSTALGAASATDDPLVCVIGDLAYYHDGNGLLALERCGVDATIVLLNNDGGGIFHLLPIEEFDPPFTEQFKTPHGLDFAPTGDLYDLTFRRVPPDDFRPVYRESVESDGTQVLEVAFDAAASHRTREVLQDEVCRMLADQ